MNQDKWIYTFTLDKEVNVSKSETSKNDAGEEITITKTVKEKKPFIFKIKKPNRKIIDDGDIFYAAKVGEYLKAGLLSKSLISKRFENDGGDLSEDIKKQYTEAVNDYYNSQLELDKLKEKEESSLSDEDKKQIDELTPKILELKNILTEFEIQRTSIYDQSAESKALNKQIFWYILALTHWNKGKENGDFEPYFVGKTFDERCDTYDKIEDEENNNEFFLSLTSKLAFAISYWFNSGNKATQKDIDDAQNSIG
ncbi:MAG: hypothetical protein ACO25L_02835 [Candidatus Nanopelagicales bacterium]